MWPAWPRDELRDRARFGAVSRVEYRGSHELKGIPGEWRLYAAN
jgi:hypothetical protein